MSACSIQGNNFAEPVLPSSLSKMILVPLSILSCSQPASQPVSQSASQTIESDFSG
ncbi:hypothetical protein [Citrobacter freundii]|uniref:hypothetical protein n=1 Tax=Citrobacter freundii TaxID=546 RepID=UPI001BCD507F